MQIHQSLLEKRQNNKYHSADELQFLVVCQKIKDEIARLEADRSKYNLFSFSTEEKINILNRLLQLLIVPESFPSESVDYRTKYKLDAPNLTLGILVEALMNDKQFKITNTTDEVSNWYLLTSPTSIFDSRSVQDETFIHKLVGQHGKLQLNANERNHEILLDEKPKHIENIENIRKDRVEIDEVVVFGDSLTDLNLMRNSKLGDWCGLKGNSPEGSFTNGKPWLGDLNMEMWNKAIILSVQDYLRSHHVAGFNPENPEDIARFIEQHLEIIKEQIKSELIDKDDDEDIFKVAGRVISRSYAIGGATAYNYRGVPTSNFGYYLARLFVSRLADERQDFLKDLSEMTPEEKNKRRLVIQWIGANDLITVNEEPLIVAADRAVEASLENIKILIANGCRDFRIGSLPDLSLTPRYQARDKTEDDRLNARLTSEYINRQLEMGIEELQKLYPHCNIKLIDVNSKFKNFINGIREGGEAAERYKKYIDKEYKILADYEGVKEVKKNEFYISFDEDNNLDYAVLDPCDQLRVGYITPEDLHANEFKNEIANYKNTGVLDKKGNLWKRIIEITTERGDTLREDDIFTPIEETIAFTRYKDELAKQNPPKTIEEVGILPGGNEIFYDREHPSAKVHEFIHDEIMEEINKEYQLKVPEVDLKLEKKLAHSLKVDINSISSKDARDIPVQRPIRKQWTEKEFVAYFLRHYNDTFNDQRRDWFGFLRNRNLQWKDYANLSVEKILMHAFYPEEGTGARTLDILVNKMGCMTADGKVNENWVNANDVQGLIEALSRINERHSNNQYSF